MRVERNVRGKVSIMQSTSSRLQEVVETVESLSTDDQLLLVDLIRHRLARDRRAEIVTEVAKARAAYQNGAIRRGTVAELMAELAE